MRRHAHAGRIENIRLGVPAEIDEPAGHALLRETFDRGDWGGHVPGFAAIAGFDDFLFAGEDDVLFICAEKWAPSGFDISALAFPSLALVGADEQRILSDPIGDI